jgi:hypothetical protein
MAPDPIVDVPAALLVRMQGDSHRLAAALRAALRPPRSKDHRALLAHTQTWACDAARRQVQPRRLLTVEPLAHPLLEPLPEEPLQHPRGASVPTYGRLLRTSPTDALPVARRRVELNKRSEHCPDDFAVARVAVVVGVERRADAVQPNAHFLPLGACGAIIPSPCSGE